MWVFEEQHFEGFAIVELVVPAVVDHYLVLTLLSSFKLANLSLWTYKLMLI